MWRGTENIYYCRNFPFLPFFLQHSSGVRKNIIYQRYGKVSSIKIVNKRERWKGTENFLYYHHRYFPLLSTLVHLSSTHFYIKPTRAIYSETTYEEEEKRDDNLIRWANIKSPLINWQLSDGNFSVKEISWLLTTVHTPPPKLSFS